MIGRVLYFLWLKIQSWLVLPNLYSSSPIFNESTNITIHSACCTMQNCIQFVCLQLLLLLLLLKEENLDWVKICFQIFTSIYVKIWSVLLILPCYYLDLPLYTIICRGGQKLSGIAFLSVWELVWPWKLKSVWPMFCVGDVFSKYTSW